jgi:hypothetical protein
MTLRERLMTTLRGGMSDRIPWNIYAWLLPNTGAGRRLHRKGLGLMGTHKIFREVYEGVSLTEERIEGDGYPTFLRRIETPKGTLTEEATIEPTYGSRWIKKYFITSLQDYPVAEYFLRHTRLEPDFDNWRRADHEMGDGGFVIGEIIPVPIMQLMVAWAGHEGLAEGLSGHMDGFAALLDALDHHYWRQVQLAVESPAEVIWFPDNVTASIISPRSFERYCAPIYQRAMEQLRSAGKLSIAHYDGSIRPLLQSLARTDLPIIEAFTPPPMGDVTVADAKAAWPEKVVWVNFPGNYFLEPASSIEAYVLDLLRNSAAGGRLVVGCTEEFPLDEFEKTFTAIGKAMAKYEDREWD